MGLYVSFIFMFYLKRNYLTWWEKYNYVLAGSLQAGVAFSAIIIFFAVQYHEKPLIWWGNTVSRSTMDQIALNSGRLNATLFAPDGYFGPRQDQYP